MKALEEAIRRENAAGNMCDGALAQATVLGPGTERVRSGSYGSTLGAIA